MRVPGWANDPRRSGRETAKARRSVCGAAEELLPRFNDRACAAKRRIETTPSVERLLILAVCAIMMLTALKIDSIRDNLLNADLTPYEIKVLRSHAKRPLREGQTDARLKAQIKLSRLGFLELKDGLYRITAEGNRIASASG